ncbi:uncharacterized protein F4822DRAFT_409173 [Hypoxylon trugodes]|uniref:uncharacterized protein n=1 Tax=Hypoxylon trugodes TaxID=326681 RepID=UPI00219B1860|nr:uncharacterized protein F4822DRAFT_409173 [Hypoxylon trugodes]KAI1386181.1 hypothetical protein F4822DRAFT_409173 [Hypoxylon trugodes]
MKSILTHRPARRRLLRHLNHRHNKHHHVHYSTTPKRPIIYPEAPNHSEHHDLASYAAYAERTGLDQKSKTYIGTRYEYTVANALTTLGFELRRIGGKSDRGIDLMGLWHIPAASSPSSPSNTTPSPSTETTPTTALRILIQCKLSTTLSTTKIGPHHVRELEGAFAGGPPGFRRGPGLLALLVAPRPATKGVRDALGGSRRPLGYVCCSPEGRLEQMLWNPQVEEEGLEGVGVGVQFVRKEGNGEGKEEGGEEKRLTLTWKGRPYVPYQRPIGESGEA